MIGKERAISELGRDKTSKTQVRLRLRWSSWFWSRQVGHIPQPSLCIAEQQLSFLFTWIPIQSFTEVDWTGSFVYGYLSQVLKLHEVTRYLKVGRGSSRCSPAIGPSACVAPSSSPSHIVARPQISQKKTLERREGTEGGSSVAPAAPHSPRGCHDAVVALHRPNRWLLNAACRQRRSMYK